MGFNGIVCHTILHATILVFYETRLLLGLIFLACG